MCMCFHLDLFSSLEIAYDDSERGAMTWKVSVSPNHSVEEKQLPARNIRKKETSTDISFIAVARATLTDIELVIKKKKKLK